MPSFSYKAVDRRGEMISGAVEGMDMNIAYDTITARGLYVLSIKKSNEYIAAITRGFKARQVKRKDIIQFASNLSLMLRGGMPLLTALYSIADMIENTYLQEKVSNIRRLVELGSSLSEALALHKDIFPDILVMLTTVGEETGQLDQSLSAVALHLQKMEDLKSSIVRALIYPFIIMIVLSIALYIWLIYTIPKLAMLYETVNIETPYITKIILSISIFAKSYWYLILPSPAIVFLFLKIISKNQKARYFIDLAKLKFPVIKLIIHNKLLALFSEQLHILTAAGITIDRAFDIVCEIIGNSVFRVAIADSKEAITGGTRISDALRKYSGIFPPTIVNLIRAGEESGRLDEQFSYLAEYYEKRLDDTSEKMGKIIGPIIIVTFGVIFAFIIIAIIFPLYSLFGEIGLM